MNRLPHLGRLHWPSAATLLLLSGAYGLLSDRFRVGPRWLLLALSAALLLAHAVARLRGLPRLTRGLGLALAALATVAMAVSVVVLVDRLPADDLPARELLRDAVSLWLGNILAFALWYWELDGGGPTHRHHHGYRTTDFLFPQMTLRDGAEGWSPDFVDYLFLAFTISTAFSPTDTPVLSRRAKLLVMAQASLSLVLIAVLAARAVNMLR